ncbi:MAG TPA: CHAT domain-containing protein [Blastocatellia bacterium]
MVIGALIAADSLALPHGAKGETQGHSSEAQQSAEELFRDAMLLSDTQQPEAARLRLQQAMRLWVQIREPGKAARAALQMGDRCKQARKYQDALDYYKQALEIKLTSDPVRAIVLNAIGLLYAELYQVDLAGRYLNQALKQARHLNDLPAQTVALTGLANLYHQQGDNGRALQYIERARQSDRQQNAGTEADLLCLLGQISREVGSIERAKDAFEEALAIYKRASNVAGQVRALCALSTLSLLASDKRAALEQAEQAVDRAEKQAKGAVTHADNINAWELRWHAWLSLARAERALGKDQQAIKGYHLATSYFEPAYWAVYIATEAGAIALREEVQAAYREYVDLLMDQGQFKQAYNRADEVKARTILNRIEARNLKRKSADSNQEATDRELARPITRQRLKLVDPKLSPQQRATLQKAVDDEEYKLQEARLLSEMAHSKERLVWSQLGDADRLRKKMAQDQMALLEFSLGEERSFVWLFAHDDISCAVLPSRKEIEKGVRAYLQLIAESPSPLYIERDLAKARKQACELFVTLFGALASHIELSQRLIIVPDGLLNYLPFEALIHNGRYFVEDHEISYSPSASLLGLWREQSGRSDSDDQMELFAVGDPAFDLATKLAGLSRVKSSVNSPSSHVSKAHAVQLAPLPRTRDEVQSIAGLFPASRCKVLLGNDGTEAAIKREPLGRYRRLHFATHSLVDDKSPWRSAVVLAPGNGEDGFLEASEICDLDLDCELVVLSGCQTGRGQLLSGEGIVGLTRAFLYAGAQSVVVSLWSVSDISTGRLMKDFYQNLMVNSSNASALRLAKLHLLRSETVTRHPYYWASFVSVGRP